MSSEPPRTRGITLVQVDRGLRRDGGKAASPDDCGAGTTVINWGSLERLKDRSYSYDRNANRTSDERGTHLFNPRDQLVQWIVQWTRGAQNATPDRRRIDYTINGAGATL